MLKRTIPLVMVSLFLIGCSQETVDEYAIVMFSIGDVSKNSIPVEIGDIVKEQDIINTGADAFCDVRIGSSIIRIKQNSKLTFSALLHKNNSENTSISLDVGKMLCKPKRLLKNESFMVKTPTAVAAVRGTQFIVEADIKKTTRIKVFAGKLKIVRRIRKLEGSIDKILDIAPAIEQNEKVIITANEVTKAEKTVDRILLKETAKGEDKAIAIAIQKAKNKIVINKADISKFAIEDFTKENEEIIKVKEKSREVIRQIVKVIRQEKEIPKPLGRLLITKFEAYFIKDGTVKWQGKVTESPLQWSNKYYVASDNYIFCVAKDGPIIWRKNMQNDGKLQIKNKRLVVYSKGNESILDLETGQQF